MPVSSQLARPLILPHLFGIGKVLSRLLLIITVSYFHLPFVPSLSKAILELGM